jgi:hypothetical protein
MNLRAFLLALLAALALAGTSQAAVPFGCPPSLRVDRGDIRSCFETQSWWVQSKTGLAAPAANFPFISNHVHLMVSYPIGEQIAANRGRYAFNTWGQIHKGVGAIAKSIRGGNFQQDGTLPSCGFSKKVTLADESYFCTLSRVADVPAGKHENRFTFDTTSPFGKRQYQSGAWNTFVGMPGAPVGITARTWYEGSGYGNISIRDSNLGTGTGFRSRYFRDLCVPPSWAITYSLAQGTKWTFFYVDPDIHHGTKGKVIAENKTGSSGSVTISGLAAGTHKLAFGAWEKATGGWSGVVGTLQFRRC